MLSTATSGPVGPAVEDGWFETYELRLEDATMAVREDVKFDEQRVIEEAGDAVAVFEFEWGNADRVPDMAKAIAEYTEDLHGRYRPRIRLPTAGFGTARAGQRI